MKMKLFKNENIEKITKLSKNGTGIEKYVCTEILRNVSPKNICINIYKKSKILNKFNDKNKNEQEEIIKEVEKVINNKINKEIKNVFFRYSIKRKFRSSILY